jgi:hypothetical protein
MPSTATQKLREHAAAELDSFTTEYGPPDNREQAIDRWVRHLIGTGQMPDDLLEALPEVSRHNEPQISPQEYGCGCVAMTRITDRNACSWLGRLEEPFEMRLALLCDGTACELSHLRKET